MKLPERDEAKKLSTGEGLIEFLTKAVLEEREACAAIAEAEGERWNTDPTSAIATDAAYAIAAKIRARP